MLVPLLLDENIELGLYDSLLKHYVDILDVKHVAVDHASSIDLDVLLLAELQNRTLITYNRGDFGEIIFRNKRNTTVSIVELIRPNTWTAQWAIEKIVEVLPELLSILKDNIEKGICEIIVLTISDNMPYQIRRKSIK